MISLKTMGMPLLLGCGITASAHAQSRSLTTLYSFTGLASGVIPTDVILGTDGMLYGTTWLGGYSKAGTNCNHGCGVAYSLTPQGPSTETVLWTFGAVSSDGQMPLGLVEGPGGVLYGTTNAGGVSSVGTVFSLTPPQSPGDPWVEAVIWQFGRAGDGKFPMAALTIDTAGVLYGTTSLGGRQEHGIAFSLTPPASSGDPWTEKVLWRFGNTGDGKKPNSLLTIGDSGVLYGTTSAGGASNFGTVYSLIPPKAPHRAWHESVLASFTKASGSPYGIALGKGILYGVTSPTRLAGGNASGGIVYSLTPPASPGDPWTQTTLASLPHHRRFGRNVNGPLTIATNGDLLGTTTRDGGAGSGTLFAVSPPTAPGGQWIYKTVVSLGAAITFPILSPLAGTKTTFLGTCSSCGSAFDGTVFSFER